MKKILFVFMIFIVANSFLYAHKKLRTQKVTPLSYMYNESKEEKNINVMNNNNLKNLNNFNLNNSKNKKWKIKTNPKTGIVQILAGDESKKYYGSSEDISKNFIEDNYSLLKVNFKDLKKEREKSFFSMNHIEYQQYYKDIPVEFSYVKLHYNDQGQITLYSANYFPNINIDINPVINVNFAENIIKEDLGFFDKKSSNLVIYPDPSGNYFLAWKIKGRGGLGSNKGLWIYYIDAKTGKIIFSYDDLMYACSSPYDISTGTVKGYVYNISPIPTGDGSVSSEYWNSKVLKDIDNQYVWIGSNQNKVITDSNGQYCSNVNGKVFGLLQGPYFSVSNFMQKSSYFTNATPIWKTASTIVNTPNPYFNNMNSIYSVTFTPSLSLGESFAFVSPIFNTFRVGSMDACGGALDNDSLDLNYSNLGNNYRIASYVGNKNNFFGGYVPNSSYNLVLKTDDTGVFSGFTIGISSYMVMADASSNNNATGSILWSTTTNLVDGNGGEVNIFYHLNKIRDFVSLLNKDPFSGNKPINIDRQIPVMVHTFADVTNDYCTDPDSMWNAFYDLDHDYIFFGNGPKDYDNEVYRDFSLDGTIIRHEYTHLMVNRIYTIINFGEFGAISEAMADYFSLASFWNDGETISILGNFIDEGEGGRRDISGKDRLGTLALKIMPNDWIGEVHDDSLLLSPILYRLRMDPSYDLGTFTSGVFNTLHKADVFTFATLFYFPDSFTNFLEAYLDACKRLDSSCDSAMQDKIKNSFALQNIYPLSSGGSYGAKDIYEGNNGPEWATDFSTFSSLNAYIDYAGDLDYYSLNLSKGFLEVDMTLPASPYVDMYHGYSLFLFDQNRNFIIESIPDIYAYDYYTLSPTNKLIYNITNPGRYYLMVSAVPNLYGGNSRDYDSNKNYTLSYRANILGSMKSSISVPSFDNDEIYFEVKYPKFQYLYDPATTTWTNGREIEFEYACLYDQDYKLIPLTCTNEVGSYLKEVSVDYSQTDILGNPVIKGRVKLQSGFANRFPGIGTVYLQIFGTNHMQYIKPTNTISLGFSDAINLTTNKSDFITYNNIIDKKNNKAILKYDAQNSGNLSIKIYTAIGSLVKTIYDGPINSGKGSFTWDGTNQNGSKVASGIYFIKTLGPNINKVDRIGIVR